jgi:hypothetical protein
MRQNFIKTESLRSRKTSFNTVNSVYCSTTMLPEAVFLVVCDPPMNEL